MRALLLLAAKSYESYGAATLRPEDQKKLQSLKVLANMPLPPARLTDSERNRKRNIKRAKCIQEKRSKAQDPETQLRVRAERAAKRQAAMESTRDKLTTENTTAEHPVQNTTDELAMEAATGELRLESTTDDLPTENTIDELSRGDHGG